VPDDQQAPVGGQGVHRLQRLGAVKATGERRMHPQPLLLVLAPALRGQLRRPARAHLGAEQHRLEGRLQASKRDAGRTSLQLPARGQAALSVLAASVRLSLCMTK